MELWEAAYVAGIIDGEGSISLTRMQENEHRRPCITIASTDLKLLIYIQTLTNGVITKKKNYNPQKHKNSFTLSIKKKDEVLRILQDVSPFLRIDKKRKRAEWLINNYDLVTPRNGKYTLELLRMKKSFEDSFFNI